MTARDLLLLPLLLLTACGDAPPGGAHGPTAGARETLADEFASALEVEVDEAVLAELLTVHRHALETVDDAVPLPGNRVPGTSWTYLHYGRVLTKWKAMQEAAEGGAGSARRDLERVDAQLAKFRADLATADAERRAQLESWIRTQETSRQTVALHAESMAALSTPEVEALVATWQPRFEALEARYDE